MLNFPLDLPCDASPEGEGRVRWAGILWESSFFLLRFVSSR